MNVRAWWLTVVAVLWVLQFPPANAQEPASLPAVPVPGDSDEIVLASTRNYPTVVGRTLDLDTFNGFICDPGGWCTHQPVSLLQRDRFVETWVFVHGNQISAKMAVERGVKVYRNLRSYSKDAGPIRFVIWSWPSERTTNRITDAKIKAKRTDVESFLFGSFLAAAAQHSRTSIVAYSFGARVASGGLHLANGGSLCGYVLPNRAPPLVPYRVAFLAAAVENDGLLRGGRYSRTMEKTEWLLLQNNSRDRALRFYWIINHSKPTALGHSGLRYAPANCRVHQYDWGDSIGSDHSVWQYMDRPIILRRVIETIAR